MKKTLYSLMLSEEVVRQVDQLAHRLGTNRSNLINQILAEYVDYTTPERRINDIFSAIDRLMQPSRELVPFFSPNSCSMSLKSCLEYRYRPTVKYEFELYRDAGPLLGQLSVAFRSQAPVLLEGMHSFFFLWKQIEDAHLSPILGLHLSYTIFEGKFIRSLAAPSEACTAQELAAALSGYIELFDSLIKAWLAGRIDAHGVEAAYYSYLTNTKLHI